MITLTIGKTVKHPVDTSRAMTNTMQISAVLKENVDIKAPIFKVNFDTSNYNYISWAREDGPTRYYWIDNTVYIHNNLFEIHCSLDLMATYYSVIQHGLTGKLLYSTYEMDWDEYFDDLRFSPSSLDVYDYLPWGDKSNDWLHTSANVFGDAANIWDIDYDEHGKIIGYGDGCYLTQIQNNNGISTYIFNQIGFNQFMADMLSAWNTQWVGPFETVDPRTFIKLCVWMPIKAGVLVDHIPNAISQPTWYLGKVTIGAADASQGGYSWQIPYTTILSFDGNIVVPQHMIEHPIWMENSRWNSLTLSTPSGNTEINLDQMYPVSNQHNRIQFNTIFDVVQGRINTKYTFDVKGGWSNISGTPIYESDFQIGWDVMNLVQSVFNFAQGALTISTAAAGVAVGAFLGGVSMGATGAGEGLAKMSAAKEERSIERALHMTGYAQGPEIAMNKFKEGFIQQMGDSGTGLAKVAAVGAAVSKMTPPINGNVNNITSVGNRAEFYNTHQLGVVSLRMKPYRCKELAYTAPESSDYPTPKAKYIHYCEQFGYPANKFINNLYLNGQPGTLYVFEDAHLNLSGLNTNELNGITDEEMHAIEQIAKSGFWYNVV